MKWVCIALLIVKLKRVRWLEIHWIVERNTGHRTTRLTWTSWSNIAKEESKKEPLWSLEANELIDLASSSCPPFLPTSKITCTSPKRNPSVRSWSSQLLTRRNFSISSISTILSRVQLGGKLRFDRAPVSDFHFSWPPNFFELYHTRKHCKRHNYTWSWISHD